MKVALYQVGSNLNRAYRTAEAFGVDGLILIGCIGIMQGNLFKAKNRVNVKVAHELPSDNVLALETFYKDSIYAVDWSVVDTILIGGETNGLPKSARFDQMVHIPMIGMISGLTVEATLAIALYEWRRNDPPT